MRENFFALIVHWNETLTQKERDNWNKKATKTGLKNRQGKPVRVTGFNLFIHSKLKGGDK